MFLLIWWAWLGHTMYSTRFDADNVVQRLLTLIQIFAAAAMAATQRPLLTAEILLVLRRHTQSCVLFSSFKFSAPAD
jgi:low temperature requirement protein LtrA